MRQLSHQPSNPAYDIVDCRTFAFDGLRIFDAFSQDNLLWVSEKKIYVAHLIIIFQFFPTWNMDDVFFARNLQTFTWIFLCLRNWHFGYLFCNPLQGITGKYREIPVMKTGTLQWEQGSPVMKAGFSLWELTYRDIL